MYVLCHTVRLVCVCVCVFIRCLTVNRLLLLFLRFSSLAVLFLCVCMLVFSRSHSVRLFFLLLVLFFTRSSCDMSLVVEVYVYVCVSTWRLTTNRMSTANWLNSLLATLARALVITAWGRVRYEFCRRTRHASLCLRYLYFSLVTLRVFELLRTLCISLCVWMSLRWSKKRTWARQYTEQERVREKEREFRS